MPLIHKVVKYRTEHLKNLKDFDVTLDAIDENGNIEITITEQKEGMFQGFIGLSQTYLRLNSHKSQAYNDH